MSTPDDRADGTAAARRPWYRRCGGTDDPATMIAIAVAMSTAGGAGLFGLHGAVFYGLAGVALIIIMMAGRRR